jgi:quercetin dioxygenase-like cupin family protein
MPRPLRLLGSGTWLLAGPAMLLALGALMWSASVAKSPEKPRTLLATSTTVLGQPIAYPEKTPAKVSAVMVVMQPGEQTGWHAHEVPMFGYILEGEVTVNYGSHGTRVYRAGDALMEAIDLAHDGRNTGDGVARILAVFMGADGVPNTVKAAAPK